MQLTSREAVQCSAVARTMRNVRTTEIIQNSDIACKTQVETESQCRQNDSRTINDSMSCHWQNSRGLWF